MSGEGESGLKFKELVLVDCGDTVASAPANRKLLLAYSGLIKSCAQPNAEVPSEWMIKQVFSFTSID